MFAVESSTDGASTYFHVHRSVLESSLTLLSELFDCQQDVDTIPISNVDPKVFHCLLLHAYGFEDHSKNIIETADQFGYDEFKVKGEEKFLESYPITMDNVMDKLSYADAKNCEIMLSSVMGFLILNGPEAVEKLSFYEIPGHLMKNLLVAANSLVLSTFKNTLETAAETVGLQAKMVSLMKRVKVLEESNEARDEQENELARSS